MQEQALKITKGASVLYPARGNTIRALVRTVHKDGSFTVEPQFFQQDGADAGPYIGGRVNLLAHQIEVA